MVTLHVGGKAVSWADAEKLFAETARTQSIEFRDDTGDVIAISAPVGDPDWVRAITPEETARRMAEPFLTLDEYRRQVDQQ
jgi:hypothetical protein